MFNNYNPYAYTQYRQQTQPNQIYQPIQQIQQPVQNSFMSPQNNVQFATLDEAKAWMMTIIQII